MLFLADLLSQGWLHPLKKVTDEIGIVYGPA